MGFRFRKSIKVAPGVKINLGKKGASVSVGKRGAKVTVGKTGVRTTVGAPGTGLSYTKHSAFKSTKKKSTSKSQTQTNAAISGGQGPNNQMDWATALKIIKWAFYAFLAFFIIMMASDSKAVYFGAAIIVVGMILTRLKRNSIINFKPTWIVGLFGWIMCFVLWNPEVEPTDDTVNKGNENEINTLITTPVQEEKEKSVSTDDEQTTNETEETVVETEAESNVVTEQPETNIEPVFEQTASEPDTSTPTPAKEYFKNCKEMNAVYPNGVSSDHPAYDPARDRDKDGWACER